MTPEDMAAVVARWVRFYTRGLPAPVAQRRIEEIDADVHDHIAWERAHGRNNRHITHSIASRMARGLVADAAWRQRKARQISSSEEAMHARTTLARSALRITLGIAAVLAIPLVGMIVSDEVSWTVADFALAGALLATIGIALELAVRRAGNSVTSIGIAGLGVIAAIFGQADDAPGLVLLGILMILSACAMAVRVRRSR